MRLKGNLAADAALVMTTLIWGSTFVMAKDVLERWPPVAYITLRFALASLLLIALFPRQLMKARLLEWRAGATLGFLMGGGFALQAIGQVYTTPSKSAFITGLTTPLVPFVALLILRVRPSLENLIGVTLATIGGALILAPKGADAINTGDLFTLSATALFALHITLLSVYARTTDARQLTVLQITTAAALFIIVWLALRASAAVTPPESLPGFILRESVPLIWTGRVLWQLIFLAVVATVVTFMLWTWGQARVSATHAAIIFSLEPVFATAFAVAVRGPGEWMGARGNLGAALILSAVIISELRLTIRRDKQGREVLEDQDISLEEQG
jgi:drug/metabolite transporter (DMT)-like permease